MPNIKTVGEIDGISDSNLGVAGKNREFSDFIKAIIKKKTKSSVKLSSIVNAINKACT